MTEIIAADIGGTNARFARAVLSPGECPRLGRIYTYKTANFPDLPSAWQRFAADVGGTMPDKASLAVAAPIDGGIIRFTNNPWAIEPDRISERLGVKDLVLLNDFGAISHAVAWLDDAEFVPLAGPRAVPAEGVSTIAGPGTGLGVAMLLRRNGGYEVVETEGGHFDFAPLDPLEQHILDRLRARFTRVSVERIVSGPGLANIYEALAAIQGQSIQPRDDAALWKAAIDGSDAVAGAALDRLVLSFGSALGDLALAHGANQVVIVGGLAGRIRDRLRSGSFHERFCAKGRYAPRMARLPIRLVIHEQPGLLGAAAAFQKLAGS